MSPLVHTVPISPHTHRDAMLYRFFPHTSIIWFRKCTLPGGLFTFYNLSYMTKKKEHVPLRCWTLDFPPYFCHRNYLYIILVLLLILTPSLRHWLGVGERCGMGYPKYFHQTKPECGPKKTAVLGGLTSQYFHSDSKYKKSYDIQWCESIRSKSTPFSIKTNCFKDNAELQINRM